MEAKQGTFSGKVALVCGAGRPVGRALALALARSGASLAVHDLTPVHMDGTIRLLQEQGGSFRSYINDTGKGLPVHTLIDDVLADFGRLDVLVHAIQAAPRGDLFSQDEWDWQHSLEVNLNGPFLLVQAAADLMRQQGGGTILLQLTGGSPQESLALFTAQAALAAFIKGVAPELMTYNINCHAIEAAGEEGTGNDLAALQELALALCTPAAMRLSGHIVRPGDL
jgi:NAD(P)-dependent dehydrogenase (short-subunit alcohol dehydrogenase family)